MDWYYLDVDPEPWAIGPVSVGRRNGKVYPYVGRNMQLYSYQEAVKESIREPKMLDGYVQLTFFFWRRVISSESKHVADLTNLVKATEDALQGVLFENDRMVYHHTSWMAQGAEVDPKVVVGIEPYRPPEMPVAVLELLSAQQLMAQRPAPSENSYDEIGDVF